MKAFANDQLNVAKMTISLCDRVENTVGKEENAGYQHFSSFPTVFSKALFFRFVKSRDCVVRGRGGLNKQATIAKLHSLWVFVNDINEWWNSGECRARLHECTNDLPLLLNLSITSLGFYVSAVQVF